MKVLTEPVSRTEPYYGTLKWQALQIPSLVTKCVQLVCDITSSDLVVLYSNACLQLYFSLSFELLWF